MSNCCSHETFPHFSPQSSHLSICYYLNRVVSIVPYLKTDVAGGCLPPRSALEAVLPGITPKASSRTSTPAYSPGHRFYPGGEVWVARLSAIHFQG